jgi:uncharacterized membrane protein
MNRILSFVILAVGIILLIYGINAHGSIVSSAKEAVTGTPTDKSLWLIIVGVIATIVGGYGSFFGGRSSN